MLNSVAAKLAVAVPSSPQGVIATSTSSVSVSAPTFAYSTALAVIIPLRAVPSFLTVSEYNPSSVRFISNIRVLPSIALCLSASLRIIVPPPG